MASHLLPLPLDLAAFRTLREQGYLYVDKTQYAYNLIKGGKYFFLSRPRRFGKSLLVSMLQEVLAGNRELFEGLWINSSDYVWHQHGVIALDLSSLDIKDSASFAYGVSDRLAEIVRTYQLDIMLDRVSPGLDLRKVVRAVHERYGRVAILIDEYDNPILRLLQHQAEAEAMRDELSRFFAVIKGLGDYLSFVFITGVSSFAKAGIFSGMNNLQIITMREAYAAVCGYTDAEIDAYCKDYLMAWAEKTGNPYDKQRQLLKEWYNGYRFSTDVTTVYSPFSVMNALFEQRLENFWFSSATPKFLVGELKRQQNESPDAFKALIEHEVIAITPGSLGAFDVGSTPLPALMFQTGYLTIVDHDSVSNTYKLGYPNHEVRQALKLYLLSLVTKLDDMATEGVALKLSEALKNQDIVLAVDGIKQLFSHIPYQIYGEDERYYHAVLYMALIAAGLPAHAEYSTAHGRADIIIDLEKVTYVVEVKLGGAAARALAQIEKRKYYERFLQKSKPVILLGLSFKRTAQKFSIEQKSKIIVQ